MDKKDDTTEIFETPEIGADAQPTGRTIVYRRGELGERWKLMKKAAETDQERLDIADTELRSLKREQVFFNKDRGAFTDDYGNIYHGKEVNDKNNLVRAKAIVILNENKIKIPFFIIIFMFSKIIVCMYLLFYYFFCMDYFLFLLYNKYSIG